LKIEGIQCPICRFEHNNRKEHLTSCFICGFPHSQPHLVNNNLYNDSFPPKQLDSSSFLDQGATPFNLNQSSEDVWLCLVCGFTGCGWQAHNHIENHYQETLHTYAMNIHHPNKVWDFAGNGFVHRLILQRSEEETEREIGMLEDDNEQGEEQDYDEEETHERERQKRNRTKVTEFTGPPNDTSSSSSFPFPHDTRSSVPPIDEEHQELFINNKMDKLLSQYQQMLVWRMTQNRLFYEEKLNNIWSSVQNYCNSSSGSAGLEGKEEVPNPGRSLSQENGNNKESGCSSSSSSVPWMKNLKLSLVHEQHRLLKQCDSLRENTLRLKHEEEITKEFHKHLVINRKEWEERVVKAKERFQQTEKTYK
jgi:hypothetical protein